MSEETGVGIHLAAMLAYGLLANETDSPALDAKRALAEALTHEDQVRGVEMARLLEGRFGEALPTSIG